ncbi:GAF domain-containing protein [Streptomyces sp. SDr-06]|uniref:sensor histidine kinase n=1 Tax=Streptomyces sp. SDr-06 TaxID=2267702 RepID=UPI000DE927CE|nr:GAF domain-containing protein [Streptomyces sp. SDr-06]RCH61653.1 GAF domain-containing protein [Streptomyces sp. SDr-06]
MSGDARRGPGQLPQLRLDQLLEELQTRVDAVRGTRDRLHTLLEAVLSVGRQLDLPQVLRRVVETAVVLVDAEYGALGVVGQGDKLSQFLPVGIADDLRAEIGDLPTGHGLLGELIRHPEPLRLAELSEHPASSGFPPHHPPMRSFLGVPIRVRGEVFGNLYMTEKRGGAQFDDEDESVLATLAVAAGVAIENARLYEEARLREVWLEASAEFTAGLLSGMPEARVLETMVDRARQITSADLGVVDLVVEGSAGLRGALALGLGAEAHRGRLVPVEGTLAGSALQAAGLVATPDVSTDPRITYEPTRWAGLGPAVAVPMGARGVLVLARQAGRSVFNETETAPLPGFAGQAALALELAERRRVAEQVTLLEDRDRIARDLHDLAIQRLFATGMTLQSAQRFVEHPQAEERLHRAVDDLDETIKIIRSTIFGLRAHELHAPGSGLRARAARSVEEAVPALGFTPALRMEGLLDTDVPRAVADEALAVLSEALSNVARHAQATRTEVALVVRKEHLTVTVSDNGVGCVADGRRSGLRNLEERAARLAGDLSVGRGPEEGTHLEWTVPLRGLK